MTKAMTEAENRLRHATHPKAVKLRRLIHDALRGLEKPIFESKSDWIDP